ncbi:bacteriocin immunity protein [Streptococcus gallolyticus]|uniref:bacteriocin immunity protein n=1 Tax=Streptococcus hepaticus TaxID=3349163 RepID=UPI001C95DA1A|nr:bacteriocin immunity protein [Streptococcus gallolyticus]MBY5042103.1 bacteriocin immunity protein [Streptococcus gallolyticus]
MIPKIDNAEPLNLLYDLILQEEVSQEERDLLVEAKNKIEAGDEALPVFNLLLGQLRPLAIGRRMSKPVSDFYLKAMTRPANDQKFWGLIHAAWSLTPK